MTYEPKFGQAAHVVNKFGDAAKLARLLHTHRATVWRWGQDPARGGSDGIIPRKWLVKILAIAREHGVFLVDADLLPRPNYNRRVTK